MANKPFGDEVNFLGAALSLVTIVPDDNTDLGNAVRMIYVGTGGDVVVIDSRGNTVTHKNAGSGSYLGPFSVTRVVSTGTSAGDMIGYV